MNSPEKKAHLSRRDFFKVAGVGLLSAFFGRSLVSESSEPLLYNAELTGRISTETPEIKHQEIEKMIPATCVPVICFPVSGSHEAGVEYPDNLFRAHVKFLTDNNISSTGDVEFKNFQNGIRNLSSRSILLRMDMRPQNFENISQMISVLHNSGLKPFMNIYHPENYNGRQWRIISGWVRQGNISVGAGLTETGEAGRVKADIESQLAENHVYIPVIGGSMDSYSPDYLRDINSSGLSFILTHYLPEYDLTGQGIHIIPTLYPFVTTRMLEAIKPNDYNNPASYILYDGFTFDRLIFDNLTQISLPMVNRITGHYNPIYFGEYDPLPLDRFQVDNLVRPMGIIIHTDDQAGDRPDLWMTKSTYYGLLGRTDVHFAVGRDGVRQFIPTYPDFTLRTRGASGFGTYFSIEMCGRDYDTLIDGSAPAENAEAIREITDRTIGFVINLTRQYGIKIENILGHYEASASGKTDPGRSYFKKYFMPRLEKAIHR